MKITFNLQGVGPGNNGGTATLFNSANILHQMGHEIQIVSEVFNEFTWFELDGPAYIKTDGLVSDYPDARAIVATGAHSVQHVLNAPASKGSKFWWIRAHEAWSMDEDVLISYPYALLSDTLHRTIFHMAAIMSNSDSVLVFEEPESHAFPYYTKFLAEKISLDEGNNQYFVATHNPYFLLTILEKAPESDVGIFLTYYDDYQTKVKELRIVKKSHY